MKSLKHLAVGLIVLTWMTPSRATGLIGDHIWMQQRYPTIDNVWTDFPDIVVATDASDMVSAGAMDCNMNAMSLTVTINVTATLLDGEFNGVVFGDLDFGPGVSLTGLRLTNNTIPGFDASRIGILSGDSFWLDFKNLPVIWGQSLTVEFETGSVPTPTISDVAADFSATNNPNGVWSYGGSATLTAPLILYPDAFNDRGIDQWVDLGTYYRCPSVYHNGTGNPITWSQERITWQPGQLTLHPGYYGEYSHACWTAPYGGTFDVAGTFSCEINGWGARTDVHVLHNDASLFDGLIDGIGSSQSFSMSVSVSAGDTISFAVGYGSDHDFWADSTALFATITSVSGAPSANAGPDQIVEQTNPDGAQVQLDGSGSSDPDGDTLTYEWSWDGQTASGVSPVVTLPLGSTTITLTVSDGQLTATDAVNITVQDSTPPNEYLINLDSLTSHLNPTVLSLAAGTYDVVPIGTADGGQYDAWWPGVGDTWVHLYSIVSDELGGTGYWDGQFYGSAIEALQHAVPTSFTLTQSGDVSFLIGDSYYGDNHGGVSLRVIHRSVVPPGEPTPVGGDVPVQPEDTTTHTTPVAMTFENVTGEGYTSLTTSTSGPPAPVDFLLGNPPICYDITTTASYSGLITVCIDYSGISFQGSTRRLRLYHYEDGEWVNCTTNVDTTNQIICGAVTSLSPFAICEPSNNPPEIEAISGPLDPICVNTMIDMGASFSDPDADDTHTAQWDWGDGSCEGGVVDEGGKTISGNHACCAAGVYAVTLTITDAAGEPDSGVFEYVVVYDPAAGFVTGGGWIDSPAGAYVAEPSLVGKASFGFVSKYLKGATVPTGNTEFQFKAGDLNFHSTSYDWLVVTGSDYAKFKGTGTINGSGSYKFQLWAGDKSLDTFRIKIWQEADGVEDVVYDNGFDQQLGGGSIVIHTK